MEHDKSTGPSGVVLSSQGHEEHSINSARGHLRVPSQCIDTPILASPITLHFSGRTAENRFPKAPMIGRLCQWNKEDEPIKLRGYLTAEYARIYQRWSEGDIGIIVTGNTMVHTTRWKPTAIPFLVDNHEGRVAKFKEVTDLARKHGSLIVAQISHPGWQGRRALNPHPVSASDVHLAIKWAGNEFAPPRPLTVPEIKDVVATWGQTAALCHEAAFDGVQVHCAHGYLLAQFLSPITNHRTDGYGGDLTNRSRIVFEIIEEIYRRVPDPSFIISVKLNFVEFQDKGFTPADSRELCVQLEKARVDFVDLSGGTFESRAFHHVKESTKKRETYFIEFAETIQPLFSRTKVYITGGLRSAHGMTAALTGGACDGIGIGRPLAAELYLCHHLLAGYLAGALENLVPLPLNTQASGTQIHQVALGDNLLSDYSVESEVRRWDHANDKETDRKVSVLPKVDSSGYPPLKAEAGYAYLTA